LNTALARGKLAWRYALGILGLRRSDVWFAVFPKSGSTWFRLVLWHIINLQECDGRAVDIRTVDEMPALGYTNLLNPWPYESLPRIIKIHQPYRPLLFARPRRAILLMRDPRDVMVSYYHMAQATRAPRGRFEGVFSDFIRHPRFGLKAWMCHYDSWQSRATLVVRYEAMREDTAREYRRVFRALGVSVGSDILERAIEQTAFGRLKKLEAEKGMAEEKFDDSFTFFRSGKAGQWPSYFSASDLVYYEELCRRYQLEEYRN
jgi:hypothetical protein